jgi:hypothetical protein
LTIPYTITVINSEGFTAFPLVYEEIATACKQEVEQGKLRNDKYFIYQVEML